MLSSQISPLANREYAAGRVFRKSMNYCLSPPSCALVPLNTRGNYLEEEIKNRSGKNNLKLIIDSTPSELFSTNLPFSQRGVPRSGEGFGRNHELLSNPSGLRPRPLEHKGTLFGRENEEGSK